MMFVLRKENEQVSVQGDRKMKQYTEENMDDSSIVKRVLCECLCGFQERPR